MHRALNVAFDEDKCQVRENHTAWNFAIQLRICLNLLKADATTKARISIDGSMRAPRGPCRAVVLRL